MATQLWCCDFGCGFTDESKSSVERHERDCNLNPSNEQTSKSIFNHYTEEDLAEMMDIPEIK